jgi:hypothetical protein
MLADLNPPPSLLVSPTTTRHGAILLVSGLSLIAVYLLWPFSPPSIPEVRKATPRPPAVAQESQIDLIETNLESDTALLAAVTVSPFQITIPEPERPNPALLLEEELPADVFAEARAKLRAEAPPAGSAGYLLLLADHQELRVRGEVPCGVCRTKVLDTLARQYPNWLLRDDLRVDGRLSQPKDGSLLTLRSIPSEKLASRMAMMAFSDYGQPWRHCLQDQLPLNEVGKQYMGVHGNTRALLDLQMLIPAEEPAVSLTAKR